MKHKQQEFFSSANKLLANNEFQLPTNIRWLLSILCSLRYRFTGSGDQIDTFFRTDIDLAKDCGWSLGILKRTKKELKAYPSLVTIQQKKFNVSNLITLNKEHRTTYQLHF